jgi:protein-S-isoprenylcysteine O-methyltransferase Ste14
VGADGAAGCLSSPGSPRSSSRGSRSRRHTHGSLAGIAIAAAGIALRIWAIATLGPRFATRLDSDRVIAHGPYRWLRHPSELALAMAGGALVLGSWAAFAATLVALPFAAVRCAREDAALRSA